MSDFTAPSRRLRGVCFGAGYFSRFHADAWRRIPGVEIVATVDRELGRAQELAAQLGLPASAAGTDLAAALDAAQPDFLDVIAPPDTHLAAVRLAAARRLAVICQKPLAPDWTGAVAVVAAARQAGIRFMVHENFRWQPWYRELRRRHDAGALGELFSISARVRLGDGWPDDAYLARQPFFRTMPRLFVYETGIHFLDTFRFLGGEIVSVHARLQRRNPGIAGEDAAQIVCGFASGATAILDASRFNESDAADPRHTFATVRLDGRRGHLELDAEGRLDFKPLGQPTRPLDYPHPRHGFAGDSVFAAQSHFVARLRDGGAFETDGDDYLRSTALMEACYRSHATGQVVAPAENPPAVS